MSYPSVTFKPSGTSVGMQPISVTSTTQLHALGTIIKASDTTYGEGEFIYLKGVASTAAGDLVAYDTKGATTVRVVHSGSTSVGPVAIAMSANVASQYGWYQISGAGPVNTDVNAVAANAAIYMTSTAAAGDDAVVSGDEIVGLTSTAASSGGFTTCQIDRPSIPALGGASGSNTGDVTLAAVGSSPSANGASLSAQVLTLQPADATRPGVVTSGTQTIGGNKTFSGTTTLSDAATSNANAKPTSVASGTGITTVASGADNTGWLVVTIAKTAWTAAATTQDITLATIPAKTRILAAYADTTQAYAGLSSTITTKVGTSAGGTEILVLQDVKTATVTQGLLDADMGTSATRAAMIQGAYTPSWSGSTNVNVRLTSGSGNIGDGAGTTNLSTGSTTYYLKLELP